jgi:hypothetical protein
MSARTMRWMLAGIGLVFVVIAGFVAGHRVELEDSACGTVFYNTQRDGACTHPMALQTFWTVALGTWGLGLVVLPGTVAAVRAGHRATVAAVVLSLAAVTLLLVGMNRLIQPVGGCGSVVNPAPLAPKAPRIPECDAKHPPYRRAATASLGGAAAAAGGAVAVLARQRRRGNRSASVLAGSAVAAS